MIKITTTTLSKDCPELGPSTYERQFADHGLAVWYLSGLTTVADLLKLEVELVAS